MIRPYGPGKFSTILDSLIYDLSTYGADKEAGTVDTLGYFAAFDGPFRFDGPFADFAPEVVNAITDEERELLQSSYGVILHENSDGFVGVSYYPTKEAYSEGWQAIETLYNNFEMEM